MKTVAPYGTWNSSLTGELIAQASAKVSEPTFHQGVICWLESRPWEKGRQTILRRRADGTSEELLPSPWNARSKVHEYGGGSYCLGSDNLYFCHGDDQQIYQFNLHSKQIKPITATPECRYADLYFDARYQRIIAVCEDHRFAEPKNRLIAIDVRSDANNISILDDQHDFFSSPRISPCGQWLSYLSWDHPNMPWDATQLWLGQLTEHGTVHAKKCVAGQNQLEGLFQPEWSPAGELFWVSDINEWWNLYSLSHNQVQQLWQNSNQPSVPIPVFPNNAEYATPQWVFKMSTYGFLDADNILATSTQNGVWQLAQLHRENGTWQATKVATGLNSFSYIGCEAGKAVFVGSGTHSTQTLYEIESDSLTPIITTTNLLSEDDISVGEPFTFASTSGPTVQGFFYSPCNSQYQESEGTVPPVIVIGHGGPTGATDPSLNYKIQFWTQRGFAVADINYRGSTGFGRNYRQALQLQWGVADVEDLCAAAEFVTAQGWAHPQQRIIRGSSAGGYSVLAALTDTNTFNAGVTLYGIGDLETLATDTHKFESRYLDGLIGPYPAEKMLYRERSPIYKVHQIQCPVLIFQGEDDKVVPPNQAEQVFNTLKKLERPVACVLYSGEGHGFRQSSTIAHQLDTELNFYQQVFSLAKTANTNTQVTIENWEQE